jgi:hypothetical protein
MQLSLNISASIQQYIAAVWMAFIDYVWYFTDINAKFWMVDARCHFPSRACIRKAKQARTNAFELLAERGKHQRRNRLAAAEKKRLKQEEDEQRMKDIIDKAARFDELTKNNFTFVVNNIYNDHRTYIHNCPQFHPAGEWEADVAASTIGEPLDSVFNSSDPADMNELSSIVHWSILLTLCITVVLFVSGLFKTYRHLCAIHAAYFTAATHPAQKVVSGAAGANSTPAKQASNPAITWPQIEAEVNKIRQDALEKISSENITSNDNFVDDIGALERYVRQQVRQRLGLA